MKDEGDFWPPSGKLNLILDRGRPPALQRSKASRREEIDQEDHYSGINVIGCHLRAGRAIPVY